jgi:hypothetical protein
MFRGLTDYPPVRLNGQQRRLWERLYFQSETIAASNYWGREGFEWPAHVANKVIDDLWTRDGRRRRLPAPGVLPFPGDMISIGFALDVQYFDPSTQSIATRKFPRLPLCLWSEHLRAVLIFPKMKVPDAQQQATSFPRLLRLYKSWHQGKMPKDGVATVRIEVPVFDAVYPCIAESYRSDKFGNHYEFDDYVHHNDTGAGGEHGPLLYAGPTCFMIRGGRLELTPRGLDH